MKKILILGGGFAGIYTAKNLQKHLKRTPLANSLPFEPQSPPKPSHGPRLIVPCFQSTTKKGEKLEQKL